MLNGKDSMNELLHNTKGAKDAPPAALSPMNGKCDVWRRVKGRHKGCEPVETQEAMRGTRHLLIRLRRWATTN
jgi:hypothetical protein